MYMYSTYNTIHVHSTPHSLYVVGNSLRVLLSVVTCTGMTVFDRLDRDIPLKMAAFLRGPSRLLSRPPSKALIFLGWHAAALVSQVSLSPDNNRSGGW